MLVMTQTKGKYGNEPWRMLAGSQISPTLVGTPYSYPDGGEHSLARTSESMKLRGTSRGCKFVMLVSAICVLSLVMLRNSLEVYLNVQEAGCMIICLSGLSRASTRQ